MTCSKLWGLEKNQECLNFCTNKIDQNFNQINTKAFEIMGEFLAKNIEKIYLQKQYRNSSFVEFNINQTLDQKIIRAQKIIQVEKSNLLKLESDLLKLQKKKTLENQKKKKRNQK